MEELKERIKEFSTFVTLQKGLLKSTRMNYARVMAKVIRDIGDITPSHTQFNDFMMDLIDNRQVSFSHMTNNMRSIEAYTLFMKDPMIFKRRLRSVPRLAERFPSKNFFSRMESGNRHEYQLPRLNPLCRLWGDGQRKCKRFIKTNISSFSHSLAHSHSGQTPGR